MPARCLHNAAFPSLCGERVVADGAILRFLVIVELSWVKGNDMEAVDEAIRSSIGLSNLAMTNGPHHLDEGSKHEAQQQVHGELEEHQHLGRLVHVRCSGGAGL